MAAEERCVACRWPLTASNTGYHSNNNYHDSNQPDRRQSHLPSRRTSSLSLCLCKGALVMAVLCVLWPVSHAEIYRIPLWKFQDRIQEEVVESRSSRSKYDTGAPPVNQNLKGLPGEGYYIEMDIGTPAQKINTLVDTGSSNFAIAAAPQADIDKFFNTSHSSTYQNIGTYVSVPYTQGKWEGSLGRDLVVLRSMSNVSVEADIAFITHSENFFIQGSNWQGILGLAYSAISRPDSSVQPYFDSLVEEKNITSVFSLQLCGSKTEAGQEMSMGGSLVLGGIDPSLYTGDIYYVPIYKQWYYEVVITNISVGGVSVDLDCKEFNFDKTIVDSGTTNFRLPHRAFSGVLDLIQKKTHTISQRIPDLFWTGEDLLCWPPGDTPWYSFPSVDIAVASGDNHTVTLTVSPQQYLRRVEQDAMETILANGDVCYKFAISSSDTGTVIGAVIMEGFYVVFDRVKNKVGFAASTCSTRDPQAIQPSITGPKYHYNTMDCAYIKPEKDQSTLLTVAYVMAGVCAVCLLPLVYMLVHWQVSRCRQKPDAEASTADVHGLLKDETTSER